MGAFTPEAASLQAVEWLVRLQAGDATSEVEQAWRAWRDSDPEHEQAWQHVEGCMARMRALPAPLAHGTLARKPVHAQANAARRQSLKLLALLAVGGGAWLAGGDEQARFWLADYRTGTGELRHVVLDDGTRIALNTASSIDVRYDAGQRLVTVVKGEIMVSTARDQAGRPFVVQTAQGRLQPVGTRFAVRVEGERTQLGVFAGAVDIQLEQASDAARRLQAGQQTSFTAAQIGAVRTLAAGADAWTAGMLVAHDMPLAEFIGELARYRHGRLACDPAIAHLRVSGIYPLADTGQVLDMLTRTLPVDVRQTTRFWVSVVPHRQPA
ncbi:fec operon regulator FecR [Janthinobacterium sp. HH103]|uniref:FecR domain-containing protein n=1 Tax=unclassified Janthinobacterium TaxID=2610881 RepID=UPI000873E984|nr:MULTISPECIES: FecR domain-containing protein [unclassified Janthinobacterium]OEZ52763.1 fec operon regulator FecR [Janthinobacterium sp. HH100]OEZ52792.1 fec operon regulator FecR [Janthinobacterium sp. HH100]OEZ69847.1 fec operon regulator FecR [Janthinobacterium sp. HH103]OEZ93220.1 fec operon regulator FecR [Janthinobacterium sp. HH106]QOU73457.1 Protein FecR [Janthinobacterium sp. HH102]